MFSNQDILVLKLVFRA